MFIPQKFAHTTQDYLRAALALSGVVVNDSLIMNDQNLPQRSRVPQADTPTEKFTGSAIR